MAQLSRSVFRKLLISMATTASISAPSFALAQDQTATHRAGVAAVEPSEQHFMIDNDLAMSKMSRGMMVEPTGDIDRDFVAMMIPHHQGAIDMALAELKYGHNEQLRRLAQNIVAQQGQEIAVMRQAVGEASPAQQSNTVQHSPSAAAAMSSMNMH